MCASLVVGAFDYALVPMVIVTAAALGFGEPAIVAQTSIILRNLLIVDGVLVVVNNIITLSGKTTTTIP